ncbi:hypothetical protein ILYODFUR_000223 [Ilyodon furcidens]|uniref:PAS domain-containing protein n=1 Tax=Ilyodon furcidens TaxID=33524 RepID=A0ABV0SUN7_9TELE
MFGGNVQSAQTPSLLSSFSTVSTSIDGVSFSEGDLLLQALNGFVLVVTAEGYVFYTSPTIQDFLGFHQSDVVHQSVFELIHADDRALFRRQLHFSLNPSADGSENPSEQNSSEISSNVVAYDLHAIPPENSSFLERNFCCRFRCLLDNSSGFLVTLFLLFSETTSENTRRLSSFCLSSGPELLWPPEVPQRSAPGVGERGVGSSAPRSVCHRHSTAAAIHPGDPH